MVYIYRRYDTEKIDRNMKKIIAGGSLTAAGILFGMVDADIGLYHTKISMSGLSFIDIAKEAGSSADMLTLLVLLMPAIACLIGLATAASAFMTFKGYNALNDNVIKILSITSAVLPVVLFAMLSCRSDASTGFTFMSALLGSKVTLYPGAGAMMQVAGGVISAIAARSNMNSAR